MFYAIYNAKGRIYLRKKQDQTFIYSNANMYRETANSYGKY